MSPCSNRLRVYADLARRARQIASNKSYWHSDQRPGHVFRPNALEGYFNDLTLKTEWAGAVDSLGLPLVSVADGRLVPFVTTRLQKALGHWDRWLLGGRQDETHIRQFRLLAEWALETQDASGGWAVWPVLGITTVSPYSAMVQGEGISVLLRSASLGNADRNARAASNALDLMIAVVEEGGTARFVDQGLILEELPRVEVNAVLNGWIFALFGLHDFLAVHSNARAQTALSQTLGALSSLLPRFDCGYWSYYDLVGTVASPFYHRLHIAQLQTLELTFPSGAWAFAESRRRFEHQLQSSLGRTRAVGRKVWQKLHHPPEVSFK